MQLSRRTLLASAAPAAALAVVGCTATQQAAVTTAYDNFLAQVQAIVAKGCGIAQGFIPEIYSIEAVVNILYPGLGIAVAGVGGAITTVANALCGAAPSPAPASFKAKLRASTLAEPIVIGNINVNGQVVTVTGYGH